MRTSRSLLALAALVAAAGALSAQQLRLEPDSIRIPVGDTARVRATVVAGGGTVLANAAVKYGSTDTSLFTVRAGKLTAKQRTGCAPLRGEHTTHVRGAVTVCVVAAGAPTPAPTPAPEQGALRFSSDWSTAVGTSDQALRDGGRWTTLACQGAARVAAVVPGAPLGWTKTANVIRFQQLGPTECGTLERVAAVPADSTHWGRFYFRNDERGTNHNHVATYNPGFGTAIQLALWNRSGRPDGVQVFMRTYWEAAGRAPANYRHWIWNVGPLLRHGAWYRYEWQLEYLGPSRVRIWPRIYDLAGALVADASSTYANDSPSTAEHSLARFYQGGGSFYVDRLLATRIGLGNEGPAGSTNTGGYWYHADYALSMRGWIGR